MLASSLRFVWGLGESKWAGPGYMNDLEPSQQEEEEERQHSIARLWTPAKSVGRLFKDSVTSLSVSDQPVTKLMNELTKRNTESVLIPKEESATLSMGYYFCMRLLCGAEIYMPSASRIAPMSCLKVLQQIASTGRKGGRVNDCYYAASAFIDDTGFLPKKKKSIAERNQQDNMDDLNDEIALREHNRFPDLNGEDNAVLRQAFIDLYHEVHNTALVKYTGAPVSTEYFIEEDIHRLELQSFMDNFLPIQNESYKADFHPIVWQTQIQYRHNLQRIISLIESLPQMPMQGGLPNAFVLSGMNEDMFCETKDGYFSGNAYDILSISRIKVGRKIDLCFNSVRKIAKHLHPSQLTRVRNFKTIPSGLRRALFPLAHAILHAACFKVDPYPSHIVKIFSAFLQSRTTKDYVDAVTMLLCENFDFLYEEDEHKKNKFKLAKITFANGTRCVGIISSRMEDVILQDFADSEIAFKKSTASSLVASAVKVVKTHHKLLLCGGVLSDWSVIGYITGFDAEANEAMLGPVSHSDVKFKRGSLDELHHLTMGPHQNVLY